ncbi:subtilisin-like protein [Auriculariales sp. MPI-PUGE-AT-0066]|nr:subtilisin-like protein [Auriculariales sp. MPI-PUGE-AT-0066]
MRSLLLAILSIGAAVAQKNYVDGGFIVELESGSTGKRSVDPHAEFLEALDRRVAGDFRTRAKYNHKLFTGIAVQLTNPDELVDLASLPGVIKVHRLGLHDLPKPVEKRVLKADEASPVLGESVHIMTGVSALHAAGIKGKGIQVAILDTGVDFNHPNLGGGFGPGFKIAGGYDYVGDNYNGGNDPIPDDTPNDCYGHGTHVAGIIGASGDNLYNMSGVAPEASIYMYRIGSCRGAIPDDAITTAILRAVDDGADVLSMSFGSADSWTNGVLQELASSVADQGVVVTVSAGNDGDAGIMYPSSPAVGDKVISVGSVENTVLISPTFSTSAAHDPIVYDSITIPDLPGQAVPGVPTTPLPVLSIQPFADDIPSSECGSPSDVPPEIPTDLTGVAVLLAGSTNPECPGFEFIAMRNPAVIIQWHYPGVVGFTSSRGVIISDEDGAWLAEQAANGNITVTFSGVTDTSTGNAGGLMSDFSSMGPSVTSEKTLGFYPSLSTPGGDIMSTYMTDEGSWAILSGTSMAAPYAAGCAALILQAKGKGAAGDIRSLLQSTSQNLPSSHDDGALPQSLAFQGAGLVNVLSALSAKTTVSPAQLSLNDLASWEASHTISLNNAGTESQTYTLAHVAAGTTVTVADGAHDFTKYPVPLVSSHVGVTFSQDSVTIAAGQSASVVVTFVAPTDASEKSLPVVSGWLTATSTSGEVTKVSYVGIAASLVDAQTISTSSELNTNPDTMPTVQSVEEPRAQTGPHNYTMRDPSVWPVYGFGFATPTTHVYVDLIDANTDVSSNVPHTDASKAKRYNWSNWLPPLKNARLPAPTVPTLGALAEYTYLPRGGFRRDYWSIELMNFANGTRIPIGQYKVLQRTLRLFGDESNPAHWDVHVSVQFGWVA